MTRDVSETGEPESARLTTVSHWDDVYGRAPRPRLPSRLLSNTMDFQREMRRLVRPGDKVLEIGFAPGKHLAWVARALGAVVSGIDYSEPGMRRAEHLFTQLGIPGDLRCEDWCTALA
jgi:23S rRNA U2552 (ribose-2'-O)-methylase RlmE/FtsJ